VRAPEGYLHATIGEARIVADAAALERVRAAVEAAGTLYDWAKARPDAVPLTGRSPSYRVDAGGDEWVVRHYWRGGAFGPLLEDRYPASARPRPFRELTVSHAARERGVPTPRVVAAVVYRHRTFYRGDLATAYVPDSADLAAITFDGAVQATERAAAWRAAGTLVRVAAERGLRHPDLNLRNVLLYGSRAAPLACVLDLDRARLEAGPLRPVERDAMVARLHRSRRKLERANGDRVDDRSLWAFAEGLRG
jgi:3-deoxy-D-manno-octulosonic acid kinase